MTRQEFLALLSEAPLIASVQASPGSACEDPAVLLAMAKASLDNGSRVLRLQGIEAIELIRKETGAPTIGLIKINYPGSSLHITPTSVEVQALIELGCEVIALDGTERLRPNGENLEDLITQAHQGGALILADCDRIESAKYALECGADLVSTTLAGYTDEREQTTGPDLPVLREFAASAPGRVLAEGRFQDPEQVWAAMRAGAAGVVVGGSLNDPVKQTARFSAAATTQARRVGAVDIGGTWIRFAIAELSSGGEIEFTQFEKTPIPRDRAERLAWIEDRCTQHQIDRLGISAGGLVDPHSATVTRAKDFIPSHQGTAFRFRGVEVFAINDGLASAWGQACSRQFAGGRTAVLALGTGVGSGFVDGWNLVCRDHMWPPEINDMQFDELGTIEEAVGGLFLDGGKSEAARIRAASAAKYAITIMQNVWAPDHVVICGGVGLSDWMRAALEPEFDNLVFLDAEVDGGLIGAASLALWPPRNIWP